MILFQGGSGNQEEVIDLINDDFENYDSDEDADFIPDESRPKRQAKGKVIYIPSTLNTDYLLWHTQLIVCAVKY